MKIILLNAHKGKSLALNLNGWTKALMSVVVLGLPLGLGAWIGNEANGSEKLTDAIEALEGELLTQKHDFEVDRTLVNHQLSAYSSQLAQMQARLLRLDALGSHITQIANLDSGEFDFSSAPAVGGPEQQASEDVLQTNIDAFYAELEAQVSDRERQLDLLKTMMADRQLKRESTVAGRPVKKGWMSSGFGQRRDPFHGTRSWHEGVDFAGKEGSPVVAVAAGIVTRSENEKGYGNMVEIDHGDSLVTLYGHNKENLVKVGDLVKKGQTIALMGSTGRSTGPHVHFEVYKHGRPVDPARYIRRTVR